MAIYHVEVQVIKRSKGRNAVGCAAYRSGQNLFDATTGQHFDYSSKRGVVYSAILLPTHAPKQFADRETLWNEVEKAEKRKDSQLAREINLALPNELCREDQIALIREFAEVNLTSQGMIVDVNIHEAEKNKPRNDHAHLEATMRHVSENGFGLKNTSWNSKSMLHQWRESWADLVNKYLANAGCDERVDHRSYKLQGTAMLPTIHLGPAAHTLEVNGINTERGNHNRLIKSHNDKVIKIAETQHKINELQSLLKIKQSETQRPSNVNIHGQLRARMKPNKPLNLELESFKRNGSDFYWSMDSLLGNKGKVISIDDDVITVYSLNPLVIKAATSIAKLHFEGEIEIEGSKTFCSATWLSAVIDGCNPFGFIPQEEDWLRLEQLISGDDKLDTSLIVPSILNQLHLDDAAIADDELPPHTRPRLG